MTIISNSVDPMSIMTWSRLHAGRCARPAEQSTGLALFGAGRGAVDGARRRSLDLRDGALGLNRLVLVIGHALPEALDALGNVTHDRGNASSAKQQDDDDQHDNPVHQGE